MSKPRVFISSTYIDLKDVRNNLKLFVDSMGMESILFERGNIPFTPDKPSDKACYNEIENADFFILIIGGRYGYSSSDSSVDIVNGVKLYNSITKEEYLKAKKLNIPIHIFIDSNVLAEYQMWEDNPKANSKLKYRHTNNINIFYLIKEIYNAEKNNYVKRFELSSEIIDWLRVQWAGMLKEYIKGLKETNSNNTSSIRINTYKLFYYRKFMHKYSIPTLSRMSGISEKKIKKFEKLNFHESELTTKLFQSCSLAELTNLEKVLGCEEKYLMAGAHDDFLSLFMQFYNIYKYSKSSETKIRYENPIIFKCKIVVFDFDGTLTKPNNERLTTWEKIWVKLGYSVNDCAKYYSEYRKGNIDHVKWCDITRDHFKNKKLTHEHLREIASTISLIEGTHDTIKLFHNKGIKLYILSGSIYEIIKEVLGDLHDLFIEIKANRIHFGNDGIISEIQGTKYDFEEKATFIKEIIRENRVSSCEVLFVGNSCNDVWAYQSGAQTLCVNPKFTDPANSIQWRHYIREMKTLEQIRRYAIPSFELDKN
jgi:HAD superfamily phosphoserine phosphatase-like hydrolase